MVQVLGMCATLTMWVIYVGLIFQYRKVWTNNVAPNYPKLLVALAVGSYVGFIFWGFASTPIDWYKILGFVPGMLIAPVLWLQYKEPRPDRNSVAVRVSEATVVLILLMAAAYILRPVLIGLIVQIGLLSSAANIAYAVIGIPRQIQEIWRNGTRGSSLGFVSACLAGYLTWLAYGIAAGDSFLITSQSIGAVLQGIVVALHFRNERGWSAARV